MNPFRSCPTTGLKVHRTADQLIKANAVVATVALLVGGVAALLVLLTRWEAVLLLEAEMFYRMLTVHGMNMLIFFIIFFEMAVLYFASAVLLNCRVPAPSTGWIAFVLMVVGTLMVEWTMWTGRADVLFTSYVPLRAHPAFYLGVILFAVGALTVVGHFFAILVVARREKTYQGSVPLVTYGAITAAAIAAVTLLHGAIIYIPTFLWSLDMMNVDAQMYRLIWWGLGHSSQQINVAAMVSIWYLLGALTVGTVVLNEKVSRTAFVLYVLFISMASAHHLLVDPGMGPAWKVWNTSYFMYMAVLASMIHGFTVPAGTELGMRLRGATQGLFGWLKRAPWGDPGFSSLAFSIVVFGFVGGITGVTFGTEQINIIAHNTLRIPGHFHATVVSGTAMAFMGITYYVIPPHLPARDRVLPAGEDPAVPLRHRHAHLLDGDDFRRHLRRAAQALGHRLQPGALPARILAGRQPDHRGDGGGRPDRDRGRRDLHRRDRGVRSSSARRWPRTTRAWARPGADCRRVSRIRRARSSRRPPTRWGRPAAWVRSRARWCWC